MLFPHSVVSFSTLFFIYLLCFDGPVGTVHSAALVNGIPSGVKSPSQSVEWLETGHTASQTDRQLLEKQQAHKHA